MVSNAGIDKDLYDYILYMQLIFWCTVSLYIFLWHLKTKFAKHVWVVSEYFFLGCEKKNCVQQYNVLSASANGKFRKKNVDFYLHTPALSICVSLINTNTSWLISCIGTFVPFPGINWLSSHRNLCGLIYNQGHTHIKKFDSSPDVQMYRCEETYLPPPACRSRRLVSPNVVLFVMRKTPSERRLLCRVELKCTVKECKWLYFFPFSISSSSFIIWILYLLQNCIFVYLYLIVRKYCK